MARKESKYLITRIFAMGYFHYYCKPLDFCIWFLPFKKVEQGEARTYRLDEWREKKNAIIENQYGIYRNFASQGFGKDVFFEPSVRHGYFYQQLSLYDNWKDKYYSKKQNIASYLEEPGVKTDLIKVLSNDTLYLNNKVRIPEKITQELLKDLEEHENKYVLAKLFYYLISESHKLPDIEAEAWEQVKPMDLDMKPMPANIYLGFRHELDVKKEKIQIKLQNAKELQLLFLNGSSLLDKENNEGNFNLQFFVSEREKQNLVLRIEVIFVEPGSLSEQDACNWKENFYHRTVDKKMLSHISMENLKELKKKSAKICKISIKYTRIFLPYSLLIVKYDDEKQDFMKVDLYSPYVDDRKERPSMYIYRCIHRELFEHFQRVFYRIWNDDTFSAFI